MVNDILPIDIPFRIGIIMVDTIGNIFNMAGICLVVSRIAQQNTTGSGPTPPKIHSVVRLFIVLCLFGITLLLSIAIQYYTTTTATTETAASTNIGSLDDTADPIVRYIHGSTITNYWFDIGNRCGLSKKYLQIPISESNLQIQRVTITMVSCRSLEI